MRWLAAITVTLLAGGLTAAVPVAAGAQPAVQPAAAPDRTWTVRGDADGLHVLAADPNHPAAWRDVARLAEPGFRTDRPCSNRPASRRW